MQRTLFTHAHRKKTNCGLDDCLGEVAQRCTRSSLKIDRVIALPEAYMRSYQPKGSWPAAPTPRDACIATRKWFPEAQIGGGVLTYFAEFNRCRPDTSVCDYITHGATAIVHAADDCSVVGTLEGLSHVCASARALANGRDYRLGLVSIGMRTNPYGAEVAGNPDQKRVPMARVDPRQRGLFAAGWAPGAVAATESHGVLSMVLAAAVGPFGIIYRKANWPQPIYDTLPNGAVYPLLHVVRALVQMSGARRLLLRETPSGIVGVGAQRDADVELMLANLGGESRNIELPTEARVRRLDQDTFPDAITDAEWLGTSQAERRCDVTLDPFSIAFIEMAKSAT